MPPVADVIRSTAIVETMLSTSLKDTGLIIRWLITRVKSRIPESWSEYSDNFSFITQKKLIITLAPRSIAWRGALCSAGMAAFFLGINPSISQNEKWFYRRAFPFGVGRDRNSTGIFILRSSGCQPVSLYSSIAALCTI